MPTDDTPLTAVLKRTRRALDEALDQAGADLKSREIGAVREVGQGIAWIDGLPRVSAQELLHFPRGVRGIAFMLRRDTIGAILLHETARLQAGDTVRRTHRVVDVPVGDDLIGRILDPLGVPLDDGPPLQTGVRRAIEQPAPAIMDRQAVSVPLQTGIKAVDALIPIGRGQRELILGDRQTGKTAVALDTILHQQPGDVVCIYCAIGQRDDAVAKLIADLRRHDALAYSIVLIATSEDPPGKQFIAPYAATSIGEHFTRQGRDVLVVYDDLTQHARAYRELSLLLRRPPGREAYPGDIFYIHSRLLERATNLTEEQGGGSLTALPIIETQAQNLSAYIPTNLISITDGQIYLSPEMFQKGILPAIDIGRSVSRVGGKAQLDAYQGVAGDLRLAYSQFEELESFARFGTRLDEETRQTLRRGRRVREVFKQDQYATIPVAEQIAVLVATTNGVFDQLPQERVLDAARRLRHAFRDELPDVYDHIQQGKALSDADRDKIVALAHDRIGQMYDNFPDTDRAQEARA